MATIRLKDVVHDGVSSDRAADTLTVAHCDGGFTSFKGRKVNHISAPLSKGAQARTIRIHELLHANNSPKPKRSKVFPDLAFQATEDARVHFDYWPQYSLPSQCNRDCLSVGLNDVRKLPPLAVLATDTDDWNLSLLVALRSMAIVARLGSATDKKRAGAKVKAALGATVRSALLEILENLRHKTYCNRIFTALMRTDTEGDTGNEQGNGSSGKATAQPMRIVRLPMPESCNSQVRRTTLARNGARLNRARLSRAVATGSLAGLFIRQRYLAGGTFLFDASGSMNISEERLNELCRSVPAATIAYYSGPNVPDTSGCYGELVIYSENGKRASACERIHGGNQVDAYAIEWLLKQPAPRTYIGDGGFCGGPEGQDVRAAMLIETAVASGKVTWHKTV